MALPSVYTRELLDSVPPWLTRLVGDRFLRSLGDGIDSVVTRVAQAVRHRFPNDVDETSLARIGRERRIRRGPGETAETYATRLRAWWDMHRIRGGPYALAWNLHHFFLGWLPGQKDIVSYRGLRHTIDVAGEVTRDEITWDADGSGAWSQVWVFFYVDELIPIGTAELATSLSELLTTFGGETITVSYSISPSALTPAEEETFKCIPREWSAAHVLRTHVVLLFSTARLWGYPPDPPTWAEAAVSGATWGGPIPTVLTIED